MARKLRGVPLSEDEKRRRRHRKRLSANDKAAAGDKPPRPAHKRPRQADEPPALQHPPCAECGALSVLASGRSVYPHREDLWARWFWRCPACPDSYVGCHKGGDGKQALGRPAGQHLRRARNQTHELLDSFWLRAERMAAYHPFTGNVWTVRTSARVRVYAYLRVSMGLRAHEAHTAWFDLGQCRAAWQLLRETDAESVRLWWKARGEAAVAALDAAQTVGGGS